MKIFHELKSLAKEIPAAVWAFFVGLGIGIIALGVIWLIADTETDIPHAYLKEEGGSYELVYDGRTKTPTWVLQVLDRIQSEAEQQYEYRQNPKFSVEIQPSMSDYQGSGFEITRLLFSSGMSRPEEAYFLTNVVPMDPALKNGVWSKLNDHILSVSEENKILIVSGPLYLTEEPIQGKKYVKFQVIGKNKVGVPSHLFRAVYTGKDFSDDPEIYLVPNRKSDQVRSLKSYQIPKKEFQRLSGVLLPEEVGTYFFTPSPPA